MNIAELHILTPDLSRQRAFYTSVLGLPMVESSDRHVALQIGSGVLVLHQDAAHALSPYHFAFNIPHNRLTDAASWLRPRAPLIARADQEVFESVPWNAHMLYFRDADGNILELVARHALKHETTGPFGTADLLNISEVGYPVRNVRASACRLQQEMEALHYGEPSETFVPVGDEQGLLIVVPIGRPWFPTMDGAAPGPFRVIVRTDTPVVLEELGLPYRVTSIPSQLSVPPLCSPADWSNSTWS